MQIYSWHFAQSVICGDNHTSCVSDHIGRLKEVFDEATCLDIFRGYYEAYSESTIFLTKQ